jgi:hypothetical protein
MVTCNHPASMDAKSNEAVLDSVLSLGATVRIIRSNKEFNTMEKRDKFPFSFNPDNVTTCKGFSN